MIDDAMNELQADLNRRSFLKNSSFATIAALMGGVALRAQDQPKADGQAPTETKGAMAPPLKMAVIGCGTWGREILKTLAIMPNAPVLAICDTYEPMMKRAKQSAPNAELVADYKKVLENKEIQGVVVATPTPLHRDIVLEALKAGKHVYCEAPLAGSIEDARAIAKAARDAYKANFQAGLQYRSDPQRYFLLQFVRSGALGKCVMARAQRNKKESWRRTATTPEREKELNWRLTKETSLGLVGEIGIHQLDMANLFILAKPVSVIGFGNVLFHSDGRDVPDTVQTIVEYPNTVLSSFACTLANSFDAEHEVYYGSDSAILVRENKAWMFKEADAPLLGWEVYAKKETFYKETGIMLSADATKLKKDKPAADDGRIPQDETPLYKSLEAFIANSGVLAAGVEDYVSNFGTDEKGLREYLPTVMKNKMHAASYQEGFEATVLAIKANESVVTGQKIMFKPEWFELG